MHSCEAPPADQVKFMELQDVSVEATDTASLPPEIAFDDTLLELLPVAVYVCGADGRILRYNRRAVELWGRTPAVGDDEERFCGAHRLFWPDGRPLPHAQTPMAAALAQGDSARDLEVCIERPDGHRLTVSVNIAPIRDRHGRIVGAVNCFQDISERKRTEQQLRDSQAFLRAIVDTTPECVKLVARDGTLLQMNSAGLAMVEADTAETLQGGHTLDLIAPEHRAVWREHHERVCNGETLSWEFDIIGLAGTRRHMETHAAPLTFAGKTSQLAITRDVTERKRQERQLHDSGRRARELLEALPTAVYTTDAEGRLTFYNAAAADLWGHLPELGSTRWCGSWRLYTVDGALLPFDQCPMAVALKEERPIRNVEAVAERPDGTRVPFMPFPTPLFDGEGRLAGAVNMLVDISHQKRAQHRQQLLINELNHRVKNSLATVQAIVHQTLRHAPTPEDFRHVLTDRLMALSRAHDLLTAQSWEEADLKAVLVTVLMPHDGRQPADRMHLNGPPVALSPRIALGLAMALHELATNAAKYGALSSTEGTLEIDWSLERGTHPVVRLRWRELGGPVVNPPTRLGFGTRLLERTLKSELGGEARLEFDPAGLLCHIVLPLASRNRA
jgi:PAS domain S-box-containing protein